MQQRETTLTEAAEVHDPHPDTTTVRVRRAPIPVFPETTRRVMRIPGVRATGQVLAILTQIDIPEVLAPLVEATGALRGPREHIAVQGAPGPQAA